jgi:hypothetical protein
LDRLPTLAAELVRRQVAVIAAPNTARHWRPRRPPAAAWPLAARAQQPAMPVINPLTDPCHSDILSPANVWRHAMQSINRCA